MGRKVLLSMAMRAIAAVALTSAMCAGALKIGQFAPVDFSGTWKLTAAEGDWDAHLANLGVGWMKRSAASSMSYGAGNLVQKNNPRGKQADPRDPGKVDQDS